MSLLSQIITLLTDPPGSVVYHLLTLFALQTVVAIAWGLRRREPENRLAWRLFWAAGLIFLARLSWLVVSLLLSSTPPLFNTWLPLLEQANHTVTAVLLAWCLVPAPTRWPRAGNLLAGLAVILVSVMTLFFAQTWQADVAAGAIYPTTAQAAIWTIFQIVVLAAGLALTLANRRYPPLHTIILALLLAAHLAQGWLLLNPDSVWLEGGSHIPFWIRLGQLIVFPLWAALAYRTSLSPLLANPLAGMDEYVLANVLPAAAAVIGEAGLTATLQRAINYVGLLLPHYLVAIALPNDEQLTIYSNLPQPEANDPRQWQLPKATLPTVTQAITSNETVHLTASGTGARQFHDFHEALAISPVGALLIEPLQTDEGQIIGALIITGKLQIRQWRPTQRDLATAVAHLIANALANALAYEQAGKTGTAPQATETETPGTGRIVALENEIDDMQSQLDTTNARLLQAEAREKMANRRSRDLAQTLREIDSRGDAAAEIEHLQAENEALRESLIEAEEAMAMASAGEGGLSTDWVMMTITRYSGQLEEAQAQIELLETALKAHAEGPIDEILASLIQELRTPMTSISGFTDLLLGESVGQLGARQREFLQRIRRNVERLGDLLAQMVQRTAVAESPPAVVAEHVDLQAVTDTAVAQTMSHVRHKNLRLDLQLAPDLPKLIANRDELSRIVSNLLKNACQVSPVDGRVSLAITPETLSAPEDDETYVQYVRLAVQDSGPGIPAAERGSVFVPRVQAGDPLIPGIGDTTASLALTRSLIEANGGRIWVSSELGQGTTFTLVFPYNLEAGSQSQNGRKTPLSQEEHA